MKVERSGVAKICRMGFIILGLVLNFACQEEERELINPSEDTTIPRDSELSTLMQRLVLHDGAFDDVVDQSSCFSINLPYQLIVDENEFFTVDEPSDYEEIARFTSFQIQFPITVTLHTHREVTVSNSIALQELQSNCERNQPITCLDFIYPITLATFTTTSNRIATVQVQHDQALFQFMEERNADLVMSVNYPIQMRTHSGVQHTVTHNQELEQRIEETPSQCNLN